MKINSKEYRAAYLDAVMMRKQIEILATVFDSSNLRAWVKNLKNMELVLDASNKEAYLDEK